MFTKLRHIYSLGIKEITGLFRDPLLFVLILYSFSLGIYIGATSNPDTINNASIAVVDDDKSALSQRITDALLPPLFLPPETISAPDIDPMMDAGRYTFALVFPPNFQEKVQANNRPELQLNVDATRMGQAFIGNGYIQNIIQKQVADFLREGTDPDTPVYTAGLIIRNRFNPNLTSSWEGAISELVNNIALLALILTGAALIRERERGTLEHLLVTPVTPCEIMLAKIWSMSLVVLIATALSLIFVINMLLSIPIAGSFWLFIAGIALNLFTMTSFAIFIACFARDMPQLGILMILVLMPMQILSGGTTPLANMPPFIRFVMCFAPTTYFVKLSKAIIFRGADFSLVWPVFVQMFALGALYFTIALRRFRNSVAG